MTLCYFIRCQFYPLVIILKIFTSIIRYALPSEEGGFRWQKVVWHINYTASIINTYFLKTMNYTVGPGEDI